MGVMLQVVGTVPRDGRLVEARWGGMPACPSCGSERAAQLGISSRGWRRWRCGSCRTRYTVTTGTALHSTKLVPQAWVAAAELGRIDSVSVAEKVGVSKVTARKIAGLLQPVAGLSAPERLRWLLNSPPVRRGDPWLAVTPMGVHPRDNPLAGLSAGAKAVLSALRSRPFGATTAKLAELSEISAAHASRVLNDLARLGYAERRRASVHHGYGLKRVWLWSLAWTDECMSALAFLSDHPATPTAETGDTIPPRFWRNFWSGTPGDELRISLHGLHIAETLVGGRDPCARAWAFRALPVAVLRECRTLRGFDSGETADLLDAAIARRTAGP